MPNVPTVGPRFFTMNGVSVFQAYTADNIPEPFRYYRPLGWELIDVRDLPYRPELQDEIEAGDRNKHHERLAAAIRAGHFNPQPVPAPQSLIASPLAQVSAPHFAFPKEKAA